VELVTRVPVANRGALALAKAFGWVKKFDRPAAFDGPGGKCDVAYMAYHLDQWVASDETVQALGVKFHDLLEAAKLHAASALPVHDDDAAHDRAVGAAAAMVFAGNPDKAVWSYNRWARLAEYQPIALRSRSPVVLDLVDAVVEVREGVMEVLLCR
jgi:hypothetical protein